ncbi:MAG: GatB/YqeY domain-containing protein [Coriobacteriales bacterium]|jgi:uncharacterized protein YqeY
MDKQELLDQIKQAMKSGDKVRRDILRQVHGEVKNIEVNERRDVTEEDVNNMIKRVLKQTGETLEASIKAANNDERTAILQQKVDILKSCLPKQISGEELEKLVEDTIAEVGAKTKKEMGKVMGALNSKTGGNFDKAAAAKKIQGILK